MTTLQTQNLVCSGSLSDDKETAAPPWTTLRTLEEASRQFENDTSALNENRLDFITNV